MRANLAFRERSRRVGIARLVCVDPIFKKCVESCEPSPNKKFVRGVLLLNACEKLSSKLGNTDATPNSRWRVTSVKRAAQRWLPTHSPHQTCHLSPLRPVRSAMIERGFSFSRGRRCGGDLWRDLLQSEQVAKQVASAPVRGGRRCGGDLWRHPHQSEQVAKQVASAQARCERSNLHQSLRPRCDST